MTAIKDDYYHVGLTEMCIRDSTCIEQVPELKHNKEREEHSQPIGSHPPLFTVKPEEHSRCV